LIELARVIRVHWENNSVDIVMASSGATFSGIRVMTSAASTNTGMNDLPEPTPNDPLKMKSTAKQREIIAVVAFFDRLPVVIGFLHNRDTQMLFADKERMIYRHASDVYQTIDKDGNIELRHPGGAYIRFGASSAHEDLTGKDFNKQWKITRNTDKKIHIHIEQAGGAASVDIAPDGTITVNSKATITTTSAGITTVNAPAITLKTSGSLNGVVQGDCICSFTGAPHGQMSGTVKGSL
jgi:hypothetical protein